MNFSSLKYGLPVSNHFLFITAKGLIYAYWLYVSSYNFQLSLDMKHD